MAPRVPFGTFVLFFPGAPLVSVLSGACVRPVLTCLVIARFLS